MRLAKKFNGEIVSADSWLVRRETNIGTAKPTDNELKQVPHHMSLSISARKSFEILNPSSSKARLCSCLPPGYPLAR